MNAKPNQKVGVDLTISVTLTETEARALDALCGYEGGAKSFIQAFKDSHGSYYLEPFESGVYDIFKCVKDEIGPALSKIDNIRKILKENI